MEIYTYNKIDLKEDSVLFIVKYIGNGLIKEMVTGQTLILSNGWLDSTFEDENKMVLDVDCNLLSVCAKIEDYHEEISIDNYVDRLYHYRSNTAKSPLICNGYIYDITSSTKEEYLKNADEKRREIVAKALEIATKSRDDVAKK